MSEAAASLPQALWQKTLDQVVARFGLEEVTGEDGGPWMPFTCQAPMFEGPIGGARVFRGGPLFQLVTSTIVVPPLQLDSHMMFAFMPSDSPLPHFTLDSVRAGEHHAFHLDLIPRLDLGANLAYMDECFTPLTEAHAAAEQIEGLSRAHLDPRQNAIMSPWMLAHRATPEAFTAIEDSVNQYLQHWFQLLDKGLADDSVAGASAEQLLQRDRANKAIIFNEEVDKVWDQITPLIGREAVDAQIEMLRRTSD
ncbi:MAG: hypothetical protein ABJ308_03545 [Halieaceae bacterium]